MALKLRATTSSPVRALGTIVFLGAALFVGGCARELPASAHGATAPRQVNVLGASSHLWLAEVQLRDGAEIRFHAARCQEVTVLMEEGALLVGHTDVDERPSPNRAVQAIWARTGQVFRFSRKATTLRATRRGLTRFVVAITRTNAHPFTDPDRDIERPPCPALGKPLEMASPTASGPFVHRDGRLHVMVYFGTGNSSFGTLNGDQRLAVPEHIHEASSETLYFRDGSGSMRVGDRTVRIVPGMLVEVPPNTPHSFQPDGTRPVFAIQVYRGPGPEQRFKQSSTR